jgi:hypothetical protein
MPNRVADVPKPKAASPRSAGPIDSLATAVADAQERLNTLQSQKPVDPRKLAKAQADVEKAKAALQDGVASMSTGSDAKADARKLYDALQAVNDKHAGLVKAREGAVGELNQAMAQADKATTPKEKDAAIAKLQTVLTKANAAAAAVSANEATSQALTNQLTAREGAALKGGAGLGDVAMKPRDQQVKLVGAPVVGVSSDQAVEGDRKKVSIAVKASLTSAAKMLAMQLEGADPHQQSKLVDATARPNNNHLAKIAGQAWLDAPTGSAMLDALGTAKGEAKHHIAAELAKQTVPLLPMNQVFLQLDARMQKGEGFEQAAELVHALRSAGKTAQAEQLESLATGRLHELRTQFGDANDKVQKANTDLARLVAGFGPMLTDEQKLKAIDAFKARHKEDYDAWEASGAKLGNALDFVAEDSNVAGGPLSKEASEVYKLLPDIGDTKGGGEAFVHALEKQKEGEETFLDRVPELMKEGKEGKELTERISNVMVKNIGRQALKLTSSNQVKEAQELLEGLTKNARMFGVDKKEMEEVVESLKDVAKGEKGALEALTHKISLTKPDMPGFSGRGSQAIRGLALILCIPGTVENWRKGDLASYVRASADTLNLGLDGGVLALDVMGKSAEFAKFLKFAKGASGGLNAVGAVLDGISAAKAFARGDYGEGIASSASAAGGAILATAALTAAAGVQVVPAAGQVIGAVLVVGGMVGGWIVNERRAAKAEKAMEDDAQKFLEATGVDPKRADELSDLRRDNGRNVRPFLQQLAADLGMTPQALWQHILTLPPGKLDDIVDMAKDLPYDKEGKVPKTAGNDGSFMPQRTAERVGQPKLGPQSMTAAEKWMRDEGLLPKGQ